MNYAADMVSDQLADVMSVDDTYKFAARQLLPSLRERAEDNLSSLPIGFARSMVATELSSLLVYKEGLDYVERSMPKSSFAKVALDYAAQEEHIEKIIEQLEASGVECSAEAVELLRIGGARTAVSRSLKA